MYVALSLLLSECDVIISLWYNSAITKNVEVHVLGCMGKKSSTHSNTSALVLFVYQHSGRIRFFHVTSTLAMRTRVLAVTDSPWPLQLN